MPERSPSVTDARTLVGRRACITVAKSLNELLHCAVKPAWLLPPLLLIAALFSWRLHVLSDEQNVRIEKDLSYGYVGGQELKLDLYYSPGPRRIRPALLLIHGGGWRRGSKRDLRPMALFLANEGFVAFAVDYRLLTASANRFPAQLDDVQRAVRWVRARADRFAIDPRRIGAFGHSAGGQLAALLGTTETRDNSDPALARYSSRVECVVDTCGPTDFTDPACPPLYPTAAAVVRRLFGRTYAQAPDLYREASPLLHVDRKSPPFLIFHGTRDTVVPIEQSRRLAEALRRKGVQVTFIKMENEGHLFSRTESIQQWAHATLTFFKRCLK